MFTKLEEYLNPPVFADEQTRNIAQLLHRIILLGLATCGVLLLIFAIFSQVPQFPLLIIGVAAVILLATYLLLRRNRVGLASKNLVFSLFILLAVALFFDGGSSSPVYKTLLLFIFFGGFLLGRRGILGFGVMVLSVIVASSVAEWSGLMPQPINPPTVLTRFLGETANLVVATGIAYLVFQQLQAALGSARRDQQTVNLNNQRLQREIEERKQAEQALAQSNAILQAVFEAVPDGVLAVDQTGQFVAVNGRFRQMWGVPDYIWRSKPARAYVHKKLKDPTSFNKIIEESYLFPEQERHHLVELIDGSIFESYSHPQVIAGKSVGRVWTYRDITTLKQTERALRTSEQQFRQLFELAPIGMAITDLNGRFIRVNAAFCQTIGYTSDELQHMDFVQLTHPDDVPGNLQLTQQLINNNIPSYQLEKRYLRKDGVSVDVFLQVSTLRDENGQPEQLIAQVVDLSSLHQAEKALRQAQKLESLGMMSSGIAHDFNNLLTVMLAQGSLTEAKMPDDSPASRHIQRVLEAAKQASTLTQQLLTYSGQREGENQSLSLNIIIEESLRLLQVAIPKSVQLQTTLTPKLPLLVGDESQLHQVVMNLVINAAEAMNGRDGKIDIVTQVEQIDGKATMRFYTGKRLAPGQYVRLEVSDNGEGMDETMLNKVFDPFFTTKRSGHGLGLATVLGIVHGHQGGLQATSKKGVGTTFQIYFPVVESETAVFAEKIEEAPTNPPLDSLSGVVLVVDDEAHVREAVIDVLGVAGIEVITAVDGHDGLHCYQQHRDKIHLILLDVIMPKMNGTDMLEKLRQPDQHIPVVLSSGYSQPEAVAKALNQPNTHFLRKPYRWDQLVEIVQPLLKQ